MLIAIDKFSKKAYRKNDDEYVYLFEDESLNELLVNNLHCVYYKDCKYADINLTKYDIDCLKKADVNDEDCLKLDKKDNKIAIIIPNFNYAEHLEKCFNSILNQTYTNYEIIFVDDKSTDNSVEKLDKC